MCVRMGRYVGVWVCVCEDVSSCVWVCVRKDVSMGVCVCVGCVRKDISMYFKVSTYG